MILLLWTLAGCGSSAPPPKAEAPAARPTAAPARATADDGERPSNNRPPQVKNIAFRPEQPKAGDDIQTAIMGSDPDGDDVKIDVVWVVNGSTWYNESQRTLSGKLLKRGDKVQLRVTVSDGTNTVTQDSEALEVGNSPPTLLTSTSAFANLDGLQVEATDPDGDDLSYRFEGAPDGLSIDSRTGRVRYVGSEAAQAGAYSVKLIVDDGHKGTATLGFGLNVAAGAGAKKVRKGSAEDPLAQPSSSEDAL